MLYIHAQRGSKGISDILRDAHVLTKLLSYAEYWKQVVSPLLSDRSLCQVLVLLIL
jgi:hypothetical protein